MRAVRKIMTALAFLEKLPHRCPIDGRCGIFQSLGSATGEFAGLLVSQKQRIG
jgi:hypothetical protein